MATSEEFLNNQGYVETVTLPSKAKINPTFQRSTAIRLLEEYKNQECADKDAEIERLKCLIEKAHDSGYNSYEKYSIGLSWLGFKTDNDL